MKAGKFPTPATAIGLAGLVLAIVAYLYRQSDVLSNSPVHAPTQGDGENSIPGSAPATREFLEGVAAQEVGRRALPGLEIVARAAWGPSRRVRTDASGTFRFTNLSPGTWTLSARLHDCGWNSAPIVVDMPRPDSGQLLLPVGGIRIVTGRVLTPDARPLPPAVLNVSCPGEIFREAVPIRGVSFFWLMDEFHGSARLSATAPGYGPSEVVQVLFASAEAAGPVELVLRRGHSMRGSVLDDAGGIVGGATVEATAKVAPEEGGWRTLSTTSGAFVLEGIPEGEYVLLARKVGFVDASSPPIVVEAGREALPVDLRLGKGWGVHGRVTDRAGRPIPGARVVAQEGIQQLSRRCDGSGTYRLEGLTPAIKERHAYPGIDSVTASAPGYGSSLRTNVHPGSMADFVLSIAGILRIRVRFPEGAVPDDLRLSVVATLEAPEDQTSEGAGNLGGGINGQGADGMIQDLLPGSYLLTVSAPGRQTKRLQGVRIASGETRTLDVLLAPGKSDLPNFSLDFKSPRDLRERIPGLMDGYDEGARRIFVKMYREVFPAGSPFREALEAGLRDSGVLLEEEK